MALRRLIVVLALALLAVPASAGADAKLRVMTRNVYLGADLGPGVRAQNLQELVTAAGTIVNQVDRNRVDIRVKGLASEIKGRKAHLVGLQEVALWRQGPCTKNPIPPSATKVRWDTLKRLMSQLNKDEKLYRVVVSKPEFDFEIQANMDGDESTSAPGCALGSEINGRLTMRDVIIARRGQVETSNNASGTFDTLYQARPAGFPVNVTRGWTATTAKIKGTPKFRFVNTHFEAFDNQPTGNPTNKNTEVKNGRIREAQAKEIVGAGGAASHNLKVILLGDLNSDTKTQVKPGDALAYKAVRAAGFYERATSNPLSCCLEVSDLAVDQGGKREHFDHKVDHILTDTPNQVQLLRSAVTGLKPKNGFWNSDHAGIFSELQLP